jgi:hypothetical protein
MDVVAKSTAKGAVGVVCRNDQDVFVGMSVIVFDGVTNPVILEAYTCREALDLYLQKLAIASDCKSVVNEINSKSFGSKEWYDCAGHLPIQIEVSNFGLRT